MSTAFNIPAGYWLAPKALPTGGGLLAKLEARGVSYATVERVWPILREVWESQAPPVDAVPGEPVAWRYRTKWVPAWINTTDAQLVAWMRAQGHFEIEQTTAQEAASVASRAGSEPVAGQAQAISIATAALSHAYARAQEAEDRVMYRSAGLLLDMHFSTPIAPAAAAEPSEFNNGYQRGFNRAMEVVGDDRAIEAALSSAKREAEPLSERIAILETALTEVLEFQSAHEGPHIFDWGRWRRIRDNTPPFKRAATQVEPEEKHG